MADAIKATDGTADQASEISRLQNKKNVSAKVYIDLLNY